MIRLTYREGLVILFTILLSLSVTAQTGLRDGESENFKIGAGAISAIGAQGNSSLFNISIHGANVPTGRGISNLFRVFLGYLFAAEDEPTNFTFTYLTNETGTVTFNVTPATVSHVLVNFSEEYVVLNHSLQGSVLEGTYLSQVFDFGTAQSFINISWGEDAPYGKEIGAAGVDSTTVADESSGINTSGLVLLMHFNNGTGESDTSFRDFSVDVNSERSGETENSGSLTGSLFYNLTDKRLGDASLQSDGLVDGNYVLVNDHQSLTLADWTVSYWVYPHQYDGSDQTDVVAKFAAAPNRAWLVGFETDGDYYISLADDDCNTNRVSDSVAGSAPPTNTWTHVTWVHDSVNDVASVYDNGVYVGQVTYSGPTCFDTSADLTIFNRQSNNEAFDGKVDEVAIWNRTLSAAEIQKIYQRGAARVNITYTSCDDAACSGETLSNTATNATVSSLSTDVNRYFQYQINLHSLAGNTSHEVSNVTIHHTANLPFTINLTKPFNDSKFNYNITPLNVTVINPTERVANIYIWGANTTEELEKGENSLLAVHKYQDITPAGINFTLNWSVNPITPDTARDGTNGTVLIMHFDNRSESGENATGGDADIVRDFSGDGNNGTTQNGATINETHRLLGEGSLYLSGDDDFLNIDLAVDGLSGTTSGTWSIWVRPDVTDFTSANSLISFGDTDAARYVRMHIHHTTDRLRAVVVQGSTRWALEVDDATFEAGVWTHIALVQDGVSPVFYVDGALVSSTFLNSDDITEWIGTVGDGIDNARIGSLSQGGSGEDLFFGGLIDELAIFNRSLSAEEIKFLYQRQSGQYFWKANVSQTGGGSLQGQSETFEFTINTLNPGISAGINDTTPQIFQPLNLTANVTDNFELERCQFITNNSGYLEYFNQSISGRSQQCNYIFNISKPRGNTLNFTVIAFDSVNNSNQTSFKLNVSNTPPGNVTTISPQSDNITINRTPLFRWENITDADNDSITFNLEILCVECSIDNRNINTTEINHTIISPLQFLGDENYFYNWTIRASDNYEYGPRSNASNFTINSFVSIRMPTSSVDFGTLNLDEEASTHDDSPLPFTVENDGNVFVNVSINANESIWVSEGIPNSSFQYKVDNTTETPSFDYFHTNSTINWTNISLSPIASIVNFSYLDANDTAEIDIKVRVPLDEPSGERSAKVILEARY